MPEYRRIFREGGTYFFTICTFGRRPIFADAINVDRLRTAIRGVMAEQPFVFVAAVVLPDHLHWIWTLPEDDADYSGRIGRIKVAFTRMFMGADAVYDATTSRGRHGESEVWQRRFWEHTIRDERDFENHLHYVHYNPVKHGYAACPHAWEASSFKMWVTKDGYAMNWCCSCDGGARPLEPYPDTLTCGE
ncbi:MAG: transposase [Tepidisphaeraceae bacterium]|jgi:putative transposase